jgi:hypothetical protein
LITDVRIGPFVGQVFVSHSAKDENGKEFLDSLFGAIPHNAYFYSWDGPRAPHTERLRERIADSDSLFVLLSRFVTSRHTLSWVECEVGIAVGLKKPVWVLEQLIESQSVLMIGGRGSPVEAPVPGVTGYIERPRALKKLRCEPYYSLVAHAGVGIPDGPDGKPIPKVTCSNESCRAEYLAYFEGRFMICPVCRKRVNRT